ncbi:MAG: SURF1 family protein [Gammaproteobacteria bacterium]
MALRIAVGRRVFAPSWTMTALTVLLLAVFISLGRWQWGRAEQKEALARGFAAGAEEAQPLGALSTATLPRYAVVSVTGEWDAARQFLLDNRTRDGRAGYEVLTPLRLADGRWLLVNRGWLPFEGRRDRLPEVATGLLPGAVTLRGRLDELPTAGLASGRAAPALSGAWPRVTSFPQTAQLAAALGCVRREPRVLLLDASAPAGYRRDWRPFVRGPEQNISYAVQWWSFGVLLLVLFVKMNLRTRDDA